jgi:hypothetical protein
VELTKESRDRILSEETYRREVVKALASKEEKPTGAKAIVAFFNSALGIWLLSTVLVGIVSSQYSRISHAIESKHLATKQIEQLDTEIAFRLRQLHDSIPEKATPFDLLMSGVIIPNLPLPSNDKGNAPPVEAQGVYRDYAKRDLFSLMWELRGLLPESERGRLDEAIGLAAELNTIGSKLLHGLMSEDGPFGDSGPTRPLPPQQLARVRAILDELAQGNRWKSSDVRELAEPLIKKRIAATAGAKGWSDDPVAVKRRLDSDLESLKVLVDRQAKTLNAIRTQDPENIRVYEANGTAELTIKFLADSETSSSQWKAWLYAHVEPTDASEESAEDLLLVEPLTVPAFMSDQGTAKVTLKLAGLSSQSLKWLQSSDATTWCVLRRSPAK